LILVLFWLAVKQDIIKNLKEIDMLITVLEVLLLIGITIAPLFPRKRKEKRPGFTLTNDTIHSEYAVNKYGELERLQPVKLSDPQV